MQGDADKWLSKMPTLFGGHTAATVTSSSRVEPPSTKEPQGSFSTVVCGAKRPATTAFQGTLSPPTGSSWSLLAPRCNQDGAPPLAEDVVIEDVEMEDLSDTIDESLSQQAPRTDFKGTYVVSDTNIFLSNLDLLKKIVLPDTGTEDMVLCVPWMAIQELDKIKTKKKGPLSNSAVAAIKFVYQALSTKNPRLRGQTVAEALQKDEDLPKGCELNDDHFMHWCLMFKKQGSKVILVSNDCNLRNKAIINSIDTLSADQLEEKLLPLAARNDRQWLPESFTKWQKHSPLLPQTWEHGICARQEQKDAAMETNTHVCIVPPHDGDAVSKEVREILCTSLNLVLKSELEEAFGAVWLRVVDFKPPWTEENALKCVLRHWIALRGTAFKCSLKLVISSLLGKLASGFGPSGDVCVTVLPKSGVKINPEDCSTGYSVVLGVAAALPPAGWKCSTAQEA
ncbi:swt1 RNA endoribonuclease isoform X4 [Rhipicephalus microplus]|uniref:swt1 RNA endoribonuclease isoform X4 n=1 Tax=Rhipicephalus microplus TaxID=6941 RepID=UPI001889C0B1|nr:transcriptional protein SWT1-like isoform X2 [Rhipicephalus microplus]